MLFAFPPESAFTFAGILTCSLQFALAVVRHRIVGIPWPYSWERRLIFDRELKDNVAQALGGVQAD
jgi:hypothetical protein